MEYFDNYVDRYENLVKNQVDIFDKDLTYFARYKIDIIKQNLEFEPQCFVDFGCGIGSSLPYIEDCFKTSEILGVDISIESLTLAQKRSRRAKFMTTNEWFANDEKADVVFMSNVIHHIPVIERASVFLKISNKLRGGGALIIFEHNPYNPLTRYFVKTCEFDKYAVLIRKHQLIKNLRLLGFDTIQSGYSLFFPEKLKFLRPLENKLTWLMLGGQYYTFSYKLS